MQSSLRSSSPCHAARVLVVEDNALNQRVAEWLLRKHGCAVIMAENGFEALDVLERESVDLILTDVEMPGMDGLETTRRVRGDERWKHLPVVATTAQATGEDRRRCLEAGMDDFIAKPLTKENTRSVLARFTVQGPREVEILDKDRARPPYDGSLDGSTTRSRTPVEIETALNLMAGDQELMAEVLGILADRLPEILGQIQIAAENEDASEILLQAHGLKGAAANVAAEPVREAAERLEVVAKQSDFGAVARAVDDLRVQAERFDDFARSYRGE